MSFTPLASLVSKFVARELKLTYRPFEEKAGWPLAPFPCVGVAPPGSSTLNCSMVPLVMFLTKTCEIVLLFGVTRFVAKDSKAT